MKTLKDLNEQKRMIEIWRKTINEFHGVQATLDNVSTLIRKILNIADGDHSILIPVVETGLLTVKTKYGPLFIINSGDGFLFVEYSKEFNQNEERIINEIKEIESSIATSVKTLLRGKDDTSAAIDVDEILYSSQVKDLLATREFFRRLRTEEETVQKDC